MELKVSYLNKLRQTFKVYTDELMMVFIYIGWTIHIQINCILNYGHTVYNIYTTGEPMVIAILFLILKYVATTYRSMKDVEMENKDE